MCLGNRCGDQDRGQTSESAIHKDERRQLEPRQLRLQTTIAAVARTDARFPDRRHLAVNQMFAKHTIESSVSCRPSQPPRIGYRQTVRQAG